MIGTLLTILAATGSVSASGRWDHGRPDAFEQITTFSPLVEREGIWHNKWPMILPTNDTGTAGEDGGDPGSAAFVWNGTAKITLAAAGSGIYYSFAVPSPSNTTARVLIDGEVATGPDSMRFEPLAEGTVYINATTTYGWHNWTLEITGTAKVTEINLDPAGKGGYIPSMKSDELEVGDGKAMPKWLKLDDNWTYTPDKYHPAYSSNGTGGDLGGALARIMPPKGTSHAVVYGATPTSNRSGAFSVEIDPPPLRGEAQHSYPARNRSISGIPIVLAELDPGKQHTISIRAMGNGEVGIESVRFYKKDRNLLAIILPAVLVPLFVIAVAVGVFIWWRKRKARKTVVHNEHGEATKLKEMQSLRGRTSVDSASM